MTDIISWQSTAKASSQLFHPDRWATDLYLCSLGILNGLLSEKELDIPTDLSKNWVYQRQRLKLWGSDFDAAEGGLDERLKDAYCTKEVLLPLLLRLAEVLSSMARLTNMSDGLREHCKRVSELRAQVSEDLDGFAIEDTGQEDLLVVSADGSCSSGSDVSGHEEVLVYQELTERLVFEIDLLYRVGPSLYENVEREVIALEENEKIGAGDDPAYQMFSKDTAWHFIKLVSDAYPSMKLELARRLGKANEMRFNRLNNARKQVPVYSPDPALDQSFQGSIYSEQVPLSQDHKVMSQISSEYTVPTTEISSLFDRPQKPSLVTMAMNRQNAPSVTSFASSLDVDDDAKKERRRIPRLPKAHGSNEPFDCTVCGSRLSNISDRYQWK